MLRDKFEVFFEFPQAEAIGDDVEVAKSAKIVILDFANSPNGSGLCGQTPRNFDLPALFVHPDKVELLTYSLILVVDILCDISFVSWQVVGNRRHLLNNFSSDSFRIKFYLHPKQIDHFLTSS